MGLVLHFMLSTVSSWTFFYVYSNANQTQVNVNDANYSAESILKGWEREKLVIEKRGK